VEPEDNITPPSRSGRPKPPPDRLVFLAVLTAGVLIISLAHPATADLVADLAALAALYGAYDQS